MVAGIVLDCSVALAWVLPDEQSDRAVQFKKDLKGRALWVPVLWWYELSNALWVVERRKRLSGLQVQEALGLYRKLPIQTDTEMGWSIVLRLQGFSRTHGISAYDAAYIELAERRGLPLLTLDQCLEEAGKKSGIQVFKQ